MAALKRFYYEVQPLLNLTDGERAEKLGEKLSELALATLREEVRALACARACARVRLHTYVSVCLCGEQRARAVLRVPGVRGNVRRAGQTDDRPRTLDPEP